MLYLYKFRPDNVNTIKILCEQRLHFSHPFEFNDPFDCRPPCSDLITEEAILSYVTGKYPLSEEAVKRNMPLIKHELTRGSTFLADVESTFNRIFVCCFSYNADSPLMWAHYCNNHTGLCLGFDPSVAGDFYENCTKLPVEYVKKRQILDFNDNINSQVKNIIFQKSMAWEYEEEIRIVKTPEQMNQGGELRNSFNKSALVAIFFGLYMSEERINFYKLLCQKCGYDNLQYFKMTLPTDGSYLLVPKEC